MTDTAVDLDGLLHHARLPSPAPVVLTLYQVIGTGGADDVARLLEADPALAARLLRLANSAFYGAPPVNSVRDAVVRVGTLDVAALVLATEVMSLFYGIPEARFNLRMFWEHSLWTACNSQSLASTRPQEIAAPLWLCGLLHDVGKLLLARQAPVAYATVLDRVEAGAPLLDAETEQLGFTHAQVGEQLLHAWRLPSILGACAARHHEAYEVLSSPEAIVAAANELANRAGDAKAPPDLTTEQTEEVVANAEQLYAGYRQLFSEYLR